MRIAVVTPCHNTPAEQLDQCHRSVLGQTVACSHILVDDGSETPPTFDDAQILRLPKAHADTGNVARAIGAISAVGQGFEAIAFLDADNWYEPTHIETLVNLHLSTKATVCTSSRNLYTPEGGLLGKCPEVDGARFVDTHCMFLTRGAFKTISFWYLVPDPSPHGAFNDRVPNALPMPLRSLRGDPAG